MIRSPVGRYIRYWYTYRTVVAVLIALVMSGSMFWLFTQQVACDTSVGNCLANISVHPQDRLFSQTNPDPNIVIVGVDDRSVQKIGEYPVPRDRYATVMRNLEAAGAAVVAFDVAFPDGRDKDLDNKFAAALTGSNIPVVLSYGGDNTAIADGKVGQTRIDQIPLKAVRCADIDAVADPKTPYQKPHHTVVLASTDS